MNRTAIGPEGLGSRAEEEEEAMKERAGRLNGCQKHQMAKLHDQGDD
jgi:hypothetical protein